MSDILYENEGWDKGPMAELALAVLDGSAQWSNVVVIDESRNLSLSLDLNYPEFPDRCRAGVGDVGQNRRKGTQRPAPQALRVDDARG